MYEREITIFLAGSTIVVVALLGSIFYVLLSYRNRRQLHTAEKKQMKDVYERNRLLAETETQQSLMKQIGEELHDTIGQKLTLAYLQVQNFSKEIKDEKWRNILADHSNIIQNSLQDIRNLSKLLNNEMAEKYGFTEAVKQELRRIEDAGICRTEFIQAGERYIFPDKNSDTILLGICREFIQNSLKHARPSLIKISVQKSFGELIFICEDNGCGFNVEHMLGKSEGQGLNNIEKRARLLPAETKWQSDEHNGTKLTLKINSAI